MRRTMLLAIPSTMLLAALVLSGCSSSSAPKALAIAFKSPAIANGTIPALYTCDGKDIPPPLEWGAVPSTTKELSLFMLTSTPNKATGRLETSVAWSMAGVNPQLHRLAPGEVPAGAHLGLTATGKNQPYSICPRRGHVMNYQFAVYAIPASITIPSRFAGIRLLELIANPESKAVADAGGSFAASYTRPAHAAHHA
jgi:phosphatidylethanolamine-binding protein (PEBP) family uncharacterized protein